MGGGQSLNIGLSNLDTFAWIGGFSSRPELDFGQSIGNRSRGDNQEIETLVDFLRRQRWLDEQQQELPHHSRAEEGADIFHIDSGAHEFPVWKNDLYLFSQLIFRDDKKQEEKPKRRQRSHNRMPATSGGRCLLFGPGGYAASERMRRPLGNLVEAWLGSGRPRWRLRLEQRRRSRSGAC